MRTFLFITVCVSIVTTLSSASSIKKKDTQLHDPNRIIHKIQSKFLEYLYKAYPKSSICVSGISILSTLTQLALHKPYGPDHQKLLEILNVKNIAEAKALTRYAINLIKKHKNLKQKYEVFADRSNSYTDRFLENYAEICDGETKYVYCNRETSSEDTQWYDDFDTTTRCCRKKALVFSTNLNIQLDLNTPDNPTGKGVVDYHVDKDTTHRIDGISGNARLLYKYDSKLNIQYVGFLAAGNTILYVGMPHNTDDIPKVLQIFLNADKRTKIFASMKLSCFELTTILGAAYMTNEVVPYLLSQGVNPNGYINVFKRNPASVVSYSQHINITVVDVKPRAYIHSPMCPTDKCLPKLTIDRPMVYCVVQNDVAIAMGTFFIQLSGDFA